MTRRVEAFREVFTANGYPKALTRCTLNQSLNRSTQEPSKEEAKEEAKKLLLLPYIKGVSEKINRVCAPLGVRTVLMSHSTLR